MLRCDPKAFTLRCDPKAFTLPRPGQLHKDLRPLLDRNALTISNASFGDGCQRLVAQIQEVLNDPREKERLAAAQYEEKERLEADQRWRKAWKLWEAKQQKKE
jgi:hypothetical protein